MKNLTLLLILLLVPTIVFASLGDSTVEMEYPTSSQVLVSPEVQVIEFRFKVTNRSHDGNWISNLHFTFPERCWITSMSWDDSASSEDWNFNTDGINTHSAHYYQSDLGVYGEIPGWFGPDTDDCEYGWFTITVYISPGLVALGSITWLLEGDDYGLPPHDLSGSLPLNFYSTPAETNTFSQVKSLY
ncbi:MAG: hypothetical protein GY835_13230 [bacterium]|nr:hypothetical protein [bacterium]